MRPIALCLALVPVACGGGASPRGGAPPPPTSAPRAAPAGPLAGAALLADVERLCAAELAGRGSYQPGGVAAARFMERELSATGLEVKSLPIAGTAETIVGIRRAGPRAVIVSAHYDHLGIDGDGVVYPGADDNASGAAILLGLARASAGETFEHTLLFVAFGAEETGLHGSGAYLRDPPWPIADTIAVINFDMVGRNFFEVGANQPAAAGVVGIDEVPGARRAAFAAAAAAGLKLIAVPSRLLELFGFSDRTDDWWFRRRNVPAIHFSTGLHRDYHRPSDTPDKLVPAQLERVARTAYGVIAAVAGARVAGSTTRRTSATARAAARR